MARHVASPPPAPAAWRVNEFIASLSSSSVNTVAAYESDVAAFVEWVGRAGITRPVEVDRLLLRRYLGFLATRQLAKRTVARKASALRRYFRFLVRQGVLTADPTSTLHAPAGESRLPRVLDQRDLAADGAHRLLGERFIGPGKGADLPVHE